MRWIADFINRIKERLSRERRIFPRCDVKETDQIKAFFSLDGVNAYLHDFPKATEHARPIINISSGGIALFLLEDEDPNYFRSNPRMTLQIVVDGELLTLPCEVVYVLEGIRRIGLKFVELTEKQKGILSKFLDARFLAASITEIPVKTRMVKDEICRWFHGKNNTDLFTWQTSTGRIFKHLFVFVDRAVEWTESEGLKTGIMKRPDFALTYTALFTAGPDHIEYDVKNDPVTIETAANIIRLADITLSLKEHLLGCFKTDTGRI